MQSRLRQAADFTLHYTIISVHLRLRVRVEEVEEMEMRAALKKAKNNKVTGPDKIPKDHAVVRGGAVCTLNVHLVHVSCFSSFPPLEGEGQCPWGFA